MKMMKLVLAMFLLISLVYAVSTSTDHDRKIFIAYMGSLPVTGKYSPSSHHSEIIKQIVQPSFASTSLIKSYKRSFNGFTAYLSDEEQKKLAGFDGVVSVFPCQEVHLQTTRSWDFMGISRTVERCPALESDVIIGVIDSGIWPESESFKDQGLGPIPAKWKGVCHGGADFPCNRKILGARSYIVDESLQFSARDTYGHGTHVASIVAGSEVIDASYYGLGQGTARGGVPSARLAIYKACKKTCYLRDVLSAFDDAIADGVDIISISINQDFHVELTSDPIAIGAFHAIERGILTINAAGNQGPSLSSITSYAPWIFTVAASDIDRRIVDKLLLGNDAFLVVSNITSVLRSPSLYVFGSISYAVNCIWGHAINAFPSSDEKAPLAYGKEVTSICSETDARNCVAQCLDSSLIKEKVVLCDGWDNHGDALKTSGALGCIIPESEQRNFSLIMPYPVIALTRNDINLVKSYKNSTIEPRVQILKSEAIKNPTAPLVASFSSRGPSRFISDIVKPDVTAPGVEILASFSPIASPSGSLLDKSSVKYSIMSGTSMACPHVAGAAAFIKSFHPDWSPSAIKSALMTTAWEMNAALNLDAEFAFGSGHIDPLRAINPGLVYETSIQEYLQIWCNISRRTGSSTPTNASCPMKLTPKEINYPSMAVQVDVKDAFTVSFTRTVTNVGPSNSTYYASIRGHSKLHIVVKPSILQFIAPNQRLSYVVIVRGKRIKPLAMERVSLLWIDGVHKVRSPIVVYTMGITRTSGGEIVRKSSILRITFVIFMIVVLLY